MAVRNEDSSQDPPTTLTQLHLTVMSYLPTPAAVPWWGKCYVSSMLLRV